MKNLVSTHQCLSDLELLIEVDARSRSRHQLYIKKEVTNFFLARGTFSLKLTFKYYES